MTKSSIIVLIAGSGCLIAGAIWSGNQAFFGALIGYLVGFIYIVEIRREAAMSAGLETRKALWKMLRGFLVRLVIVTIIVWVVARFQVGWLLYLAIGMAVGVVLSISTISIHMIQSKGGEK